MKINDIMAFIYELSKSQGFYGRLYNHLCEVRRYEPEDFELIVAELERQNFKDGLDIVFYFEC